MASSPELEPPARSINVVQFGAFELNRNAGELRKQGTRVRLQPKPLQILFALLEKPGEIVTRDELKSRLWPNDTFVDFENGLNTAVNRLRIALGDSAEHPRYIETQARSGYRFIAPAQAKVEPAVVIMPPRRSTAGTGHTTANGSAPVGRGPRRLGNRTGCEHSLTADGPARQFPANHLPKRASFGCAFHWQFKVCIVRGSMGPRTPANLSGSGGRSGFACPRV